MSDEGGILYLRIYGTSGKTGKIKINEGRFDKKAIENYELRAPDCGKVLNLIFFKFLIFN